MPAHDFFLWKMGCKIAPAAWQSQTGVFLIFNFALFFSVSSGAFYKKPKHFTMKRILFVPACLIALLMACKQPEATSTAPVATFSLDSAKMDIEASNVKFGAAFIKGDSATIAGLYTSDAEVYAPNMPKSTASEMASGIKPMAAMKLTSMVLTSKEVSGGPDLVSETGVYEMRDSSKSIDKGKYIVLWKKQDGKWKLYRDIWNSDNPPPPSAPAPKK
jgi:ketosteroid isomerase-like protein